MEVGCDDSGHLDEATEIVFGRIDGFVLGRV